MTVVSVGDRSVWRAKAIAYKAAMRKALARVSVEGMTLLGMADAIATSSQIPAEAAIAWFDVTLYERWNPDIQRWAPMLLHAARDRLGRPMLSEEATQVVIDDIFMLAQAIEAGNDKIALDTHARIVAGLGA